MSSDGKKIQSERGSLSRKSSSVDKAIAVQNGTLAGVRSGWSCGIGRRPRMRWARAQLTYVEVSCSQMVN